MKISKITGLAALVSSLAYATPLTEGEIGAINAFGRYWEGNQFHTFDTWGGIEDSTNTVQTIDYTAFIDKGSADTTQYGLIDTNFLMALADRPILTALQRRAVRYNNGSVLEGTTGVNYNNRSEAEIYYDTNLIVPHIPQQTGIPDPYENTIRQSTWGYIKNFSRNK